MPNQEVDGLTDGALADGTFVRVFWLWDSDHPDDMRYRARIAGTDYGGTYGFETFRRFVADHHGDPDARTDVDIGPHVVRIPTQYLAVHLACCRRMLRAGTGDES